MCQKKKALFPHKIIRKKWALKTNPESFYLVLPSFSSFIPVALGPTSVQPHSPFSLRLWGLVSEGLRISRVVSPT